MVSRGWRGAGRPPPIRSLESLWQEHGGRIELFVGRALGSDPDAVRAACYLTMLEAGRRILEHGSPTSSDRWSWLARIAHDACLEVQSPSFDSSSVPAGSLPGSLSPRLRALVRWRGLREWATWRAGRFGLAALPASFAERLRSGLSRVAHRAGRRLDLPSAGQAAAINLAHSGLAEAAVAVAAAVALGVAAPTGEATLPARHPVAPVASRTTVSAAPPEPERVGPAVPIRAGGGDAAVSGHAGAAPGPYDPVPSAPPNPGRVEVGEAAPEPEVDVDSERVHTPVRAEPHDSGTEWSTSDEPATADLEGDDTDELTVQPPIAGIDCPRPEERGVVTGAACPLLDSAPAQAL